MRKLQCLTAIVFALSAFAPASTSARPVKKPLDNCRTVLGTWRITSLGMPWTYDVRADGTAVVDGGNPMTWTCAGNVVTFRNALGANVRLTVSSDGAHVSGTMTDGMPASGVRTGAPPAELAAGARPARGKGGSVPAKGSARDRYCAAQWLPYKAQWLQEWDDEYSLGEGPMAPEDIENGRRQFMQRCLAGHVPTMDEDL